MKPDFLSVEIPLLFPFLEGVLQDGGKKVYGHDFAVSNNPSLDGMSGYLLHAGNETAKITFGILLGGIGFVLKREFQSGDTLEERFDHFDVNGRFTFTSDKKVLEPLLIVNFEMDLSCPILNHLYNFLSLVYKEAAEGKSKTTNQVNTVEKFLRHLYHDQKVHLPVRDGIRDSAISNIYNKILNAEMDPVLTWEERQIVFKKQKETLKQILATKVRAHNLNRVKLSLGMVQSDFSNFIRRFLSRPQNNAKGLLYQYTIAKILWFFRTVKNNLGYSVALAVYGPFTYYFITMPMNPHAMQAVGKVRTAYLTVKHELTDILSASSEDTFTSPKAIAAAVALKADNSLIKMDTVSTTNAAPINQEANSQALANVIYPSQVADISNTKTILNLTLTTNSDDTNKVSWSERMSNFKQMQIAYEENIEYASRMGRLEQLETQYNFPMQIESAWEELERYNNFIFKTREENPNLSAKMKQYLTNEVNRTQQLELYLWDRMGRFILDQIYVMLDQDQEQKRNDYYVGRAFVFMQEMTNILSWRYQNFKKHEGYDRIEKLAQFYNNSRKEFGTVMKNLQANSDLFKQKDVFDTQEFRSHIKRQWEILFLQNAKAEEASNMGLNMYIWSVRNTVWILQSVYSAKREELNLLLKRDLSGQMLSPTDQLARNKISMLYETFLHNLTLEYVGIREEMKKRLGKDIESNQRMVVIENLKEFLSDREKLDGLVMAAKEESKSQGQL